MAAAEEAERAEALRAESAEAALAVARREMDAARQRAAELGELEARYWHDFNDFQLQLRAHVDERDVLLRKVCSAPSTPTTDPHSCPPYMPMPVLRDCQYCTEAPVLCSTAAEPESMVSALASSGRVILSALNLPEGCGIGRWACMCLCADCTAAVVARFDIT